MSILCKSKSNRKFSKCLCESSVMSLIMRFNGGRNGHESGVKKTGWDVTGIGDSVLV